MGINDNSKDIPEIFKNGVIKKKVPNPTNWKLSSLTSIKNATKEKLPRKVNLKPKFPPVYRQKYGSCTANTAVACDAYYYHNPKGSWVPSATFTYYNSRLLDDKDNVKEDCGSSIESALNAVRKYGVCNADVWPNDQPYDEKPDKDAYADGLKGKELTKYYNVKSLLQVKKALSLGYPVAASFAWPFKGPNPYTYFLDPPDDKVFKKCYSGHAVVIVGYDDSKKAFEIRNSWGDYWGNKGYCYMSYDTFKKAIWYEDTYAIVK